MSLRTRFQILSGSSDGTSCCRIFATSSFTPLSLQSQAPLHRTVSY
jgi:hypothetical protein